MIETIACLGWGSLIWSPGVLDSHNIWFEDGPVLPIEFARQSSDGRLTLVISDPKQSEFVRVLWTLMHSANLENAKENLADREKIPHRKIDQYIGFLTPKSKPKNEIEKVIMDWKKLMRLNSVIWTNLPPKFNDEEGRAPSFEEADDYLIKLPLPRSRLAWEYIQKTPKQIDTKFRRKFNQKYHLGILTEQQ